MIVSNMNDKIKEKKIIRILGVGQFEVDTNLVIEINKIDNQIVSLLQNKENNESVKTEFDNKITEIYNIVKEKGTALKLEEIVVSDIIIPGKDITLNEARQIFEGEGIVKDV